MTKTWGDLTLQWTPSQTGIPPRSFAFFPMPHATDAAVFAVSKGLAHRETLFDAAAEQLTTVLFSIVTCGPTAHRRALRSRMPPTYRRDKGRPGPTLVSWRSGGCSAASQGQARRSQASPARPARRASREIPAEIAGAIARHPASTPNSLRHGTGGSGRNLQLDDGSLPPPVSTMIWRSTRRKALR